MYGIFLNTIHIWHLFISAILVLPSVVLKGVSISCITNVYDGQLEIILGLAIVALGEYFYE